MKFTALAKAKINNSEFGALAGVSRVTVSLWVNGHVGPHKLHEKRIKLLVDAVTQAVSAGDLPLSDDVGREDRAKKLRSVIARHIQKN